MVRSLLAALTLCLSACSPPADTATTELDFQNPNLAQGIEVGRLPLKLGHYVGNHIACTQAQDADVSLLTATGFEHLHQQCTFERIEQLSPDTFRVTEACTDFDAALRQTATYQVTGDSAFTQTAEGGRAYSARFCAAADIPEVWRNREAEAYDDRPRGWDEQH